MSGQLKSSEHPRAGGFSEPGKRIALMYWGAEGDGVASHLAGYAAELARRGHEVTWYMGTRNTKVSIPHVKMVYSELLDLEAPAPGAEDVRRRFERQAENSAFDVVHLHNAHYFRPEIAAGLLQLREKYGLPLGHTYHSPFAGAEAERTATVVNPIRGLAVSDWMRGWAADKGASVRTSRLGVNLDRYANVPELKLSAGEPVTFGVAARMVPNKGIREFYEAYARVIGDWDARLDGPRPRLLIASPAQSVGMGYEKADGYKSDLQAKIERAGHADLVRFMNATAPEMPGVFAQAHKWYSPTLTEEAFGLASVEAQLAGRPSGVNDVGGLPETVEQGSGSVMRVPASGDLDTRKNAVTGNLAVDMRMSAKNRKGLEEKGARARVFAKGAFDERRQVDDVLAYYDDVTTAATHTPREEIVVRGRRGGPEAGRADSRPRNDPAPQGTGQAKGAPPGLGDRPEPHSRADDLHRGIEKEK